MQAFNAHRFAPAALGEDFVFGACAPGWHSAATHDAALDDWISFMRADDVERVCCLLPGRQLDAAGANLDRYRAAFGAENVCHAPSPDHDLLDVDLVTGTVLPFLVESRDAGQRVVVHGLAGLGRTGQVLAAWLVHNRDYGPDRAVATVREMGRDPADGVDAGSAAMDDLRTLLAAVRTD